MAASLSVWWLVASIRQNERFGQREIGAIFVRTHWFPANRARVRRAGSPAHWQAGRLPPPSGNTLLFCSAHRFLPVPQHALGRFPADTGVGDRHAVTQILQAFWNRLTALLQITLDHQADESGVPGSALVEDALPDFLLARVLFSRVGMAAVHHEYRRQTGLLQRDDGGSDAFGIVVRLPTTAAQYDVTVRISRRADDAGDAVLIDAEKTVGRARGRHGVNGDLQAAVGRVFEADLHGQTARHLAVRLGFRRAGADRRPTHQVGKILRHDGIEKFGRCRQPHPGDLQKQTPRFLQAGFDVVGTVEVRVVDQSFPTDRRARLFKINPHDDGELAGQLFAEAVELSRVFERAFQVVDRTRTDNDQQARVFPAQNPFYHFAAFDDRLVRPLGHREFVLQRPRRKQSNDFFYVSILCRL